MPSSRRHRMLRASAFTAGALVLAGVFALYAQPEFVVSMIDQLWACF